jgi:hypothetical protein
MVEVLYIKKICLVIYICLTDCMEGSCDVSLREESFNGIICMYMYVGGVL